MEKQGWDSVHIFPSRGRDGFVIRRLPGQRLQAPASCIHLATIHSLPEFFVSF